MGLAVDLELKGLSVRAWVESVVKSEFDLRRERRRTDCAPRRAPFRQRGRPVHRRIAQRQDLGIHRAADGKRRHGRADRRHHRTQGGGSQDQPPGPVRRAHRPAKPHGVARPHGTRAQRMAPGQYVRDPLHRSRSVQAGQRHFGPHQRRYASGSGRRTPALRHSRGRRHLTVRRRRVRRACRRR